MLRYLLLMALVDGFFIQESLFNRFGTIRFHSLRSSSIATQRPCLSGFRWKQRDVRFVTKDQAKLVLEIWTTNKEWGITRK